MIRFTLLLLTAFSLSFFQACTEDDDPVDIIKDAAGQGSDSDFFDLTINGNPQSFDLAVAARTSGIVAVTASQLPDTFPQASFSVSDRLLPDTFNLPPFTANSPMFFYSINDSTTYNIRSGQIILSENDTTNKVVSASFDLTLIIFANPSDTLKAVGSFRQTY